MTAYSDRNKFPLGDAVPDLRGYPFAAAFAMAVAYSGKSETEIAASMHWSRSMSSRIFHNQDYWMSLPTVPDFCSVVGNTIVARWIIDNADFLVQQAAPADVPTLFRQLRELLREVAALMDEVQSASVDGEIDGRESRRMVRELTGLFRVGGEMLAALYARIEAERGGR